MNKLIYRVECKNSGLGPYQSSRIPLKSWSTRQHGEGTTATPGYDPEIREYGEKQGWFDNGYIGHLFFAFESTESLYDWFTDKELSKLMAAGFIVKKYEVPEEFLVTGTYQVIFTQDSVVSKKELIRLPKRKKIHPQENYVYQEKKWTEAQSAKFLKNMRIL